MAAFDPNNLTKASLPEAIKICINRENIYKDKEVKKKKYEDMRKVFEKAQKTLDKAIEKTRTIKMDGDKSFYEEFVSGNETAVSLSWLGMKLAEQREHIREGEAPNLGEFGSVAYKYDFIDKTKQVGIDFTKGKGLAKGITNVAVGVLVGELLTQGVTAFLTKKGIMDGAMGLIGLGKLGIEFAPTAWQAITMAATSLAGWSMPIVVAGATLAAVKAVPMIRSLVEKVKAKHKEAGAFDANMQKLIAEQKVMEERS